MPLNFSAEELKDMILLYGKCRGNENAALGLYTERFPAGRQPNNGRVIVNMLIRLRNNNPLVPINRGGAQQLYVLARNPNNILRYLGPVLGVTVPTLHLGMLFSTSCWHRDPHGLPWIEYMHSGAQKIWYGIPRDESANFRRAVETLCPAYCQNKAIWLASEITMVPPTILSEHGVKLSRLLQAPGEYVLVFPEAHSCSITTGFAISESVYFASNAWLNDVYKLFQELRNSCEPTMFSLEQLLLNGSADVSAPTQVCSVLSTLVSAELEHRRALEQKGLKVALRPPSNAPLNTRDQDECQYCRSTLFLSKLTNADFSLRTKRQQYGTVKPHTPNPRWH